jgi:aryl-alcohol dehydrogenase-like predicted oxidoreductase
VGGKYANGLEEEKRLERTPHFQEFSGRNLAIANLVLEVARESGHSAAQVALN